MIGLPPTDNRYLPVEMEAAPSTSTGSGFSFVTFIYIFLGCVALYYVYTSVMGTSYSRSVKLFADKKNANSPINAYPGVNPPSIFEGGDYTINFWIYVSSMNLNNQKRKHIFEIKGTNFSSLVVGLGAFRNMLVVRTHNAPAASGPGSGDSLRPANITTMFNTQTTDTESTMEQPPVCDIPEVDLQRWVMVSIVISGRLIDVYMDGKLTRSCTTGSYFKVDPTGTSLRFCDYGGFDGYVSNASISNTVLTPDEIYKLYLTGPEGGITLDIVRWFTNLFYPQK